MEGAETPCCPATAPKPEDLEKTCMEEWAKSLELQETSDLCNCEQSFLYQILSSLFSIVSDTAFMQ